MKAAIILCGGKGQRAALGYNKILFPIGGKSLLELSLNSFSGFDRVIVVSAGEDKTAVEDICSAFKDTLALKNLPCPEILVAEGGDTRTESARRGLKAVEILERAILSAEFGEEKSAATKKSMERELDGRLKSMIVAIHDGARPFASGRLIDEAMESAEKYGSGIPAVTPSDSFRIAEDGVIVESLPRERLKAVQTPQCFRFADILAAYDIIAGDYTDDGDAYRAAGFIPFLTNGDVQNKKLTTAEDFFGFGKGELFIGKDLAERRELFNRRAEAVKNVREVMEKMREDLKIRREGGIPQQNPVQIPPQIPPQMTRLSDEDKKRFLEKLPLSGSFLPLDKVRPFGNPLGGSFVGAGIDVHRLVLGRKLILGGVEIPFDKGLDGHSDADVLLHAICDALLSAAGLPDIGVLYPDNDPALKNMDSREFLKDAAGRLTLGRLRLRSVSAVIVAQSPKLSGHIESMRRIISEILRVDMRCVNISATTAEFMGLIGGGEAMAALAFCLVDSM